MKILNRFILISIMFFSSCSTHAGNNLQTDDQHLAILGDWTVDIVAFAPWNPLYKIFEGEGAFQIETKNKHGDILGIVCSGGDTGKCVPYVNLNSPCGNMGQYSALLSTDSGTSCVSMECAAETDFYFLFLLPEDHVDYILSGNKYGMAYGTNDGFRAAHFSLNGSTKAFLEGRRLLGDVFSTPKVEKIDPASKNTAL